MALDVRKVAAVAGALPPPGSITTSLEAVSVLSLCAELEEDGLSRIAHAMLPRPRTVDSATDVVRRGFEGAERFMSRPRPVPHGRDGAVTKGHEFQISSA